MNDGIYTFEARWGSPGKIGAMTIAEPPDPERPKKTALQKLQEDLDRQMKPFRDIEKMYEQLRPYNQLQDIQAQMKRYSPEQQLRDLFRPFASDRLIRDMLDPGSATKQQVQRMTEAYFPKTAAAFRPLGPDADTFRKALGLDDASRLASKMLQDALPKISAHERLLEQMQRQMLGGLSAADFARQLEQANPVFSAIEAARKSIDSIFGTLRDVDLSAFRETGDENLREAEHQVENISQAAVDQADLRAAAEQIATAVAAQPNPLVRLLLWVHFRTLLNHIYGGVVSTVIAVAVTSCMNRMDASKTTREAAKDIKEAARAVVTVPDMLADQRYISAKVVAVRKNPRAKSPEIARLRFGSVVRVIKKEKAFTLVVWADKESGAEIQGWVNSRYLGKFN